MPHALATFAEILETILHDGVQVAHQYQRNTDICADFLQLAEEFSERHSVAQGLCGCVLNDRTVGHRVTERDTYFYHLYSLSVPEVRMTSAVPSRVGATGTEINGKDTWCLCAGIID